MNPSDERFEQARELAEDARDLHDERLARVDRLADYAPAPPVAAMTEAEKRRLSEASHVLDTSPEATLRLLADGLVSDTRGAIPQWRARDLLPGDAA